MTGWIARLWGRTAPMLSPAGAADASSFAALHGESFRRGWTREEFEQLLLDRHVAAHRALVGDRLIGLILSRWAADEAEILSVAVAPPRRSRGIGGALLRLHLQRLAGLGVHHVFLEVEDDNVPARRLYEHAGFLEVGQRESYFAPARGVAARARVLRRYLA